ncbi:winged helix-turn-helix domain-containing protein [Arthrobacter castelli]|uniref:winged helix-turn-helix domain-containing protein n=1 Tax=Arthrobacter castelli TaxID=271431 RepID=UPI00040CB5AB|nr:winged helix-turn-helix domain-containing protein [Arthrobacter castelli]
MSVSSGYVHISLRNRNNAGPQSRQQPAGENAYGAGPEAQAYARPAGYRPLRAVPSQDSAAHAGVEPAPMTAPTQVVAANGQQGSGVRPVSNDNVARGFVLYLGLDEEAAAANGTTLTKLVQDIRSYAQSLVPDAESYAAVALAPADATGSDIEVVRNALGDPTVAGNVRVEPARTPQPPQAPRPTGVLIDLSRREVHLDGDTLNLTFKEFELLNYLVENGQRTVAREELLTGLWRNSDEVPNERTIDVHIRRLRSKLGRLANTVRTVRGQGYRFYEHPEVVVWAAPEYSI